MKILGQVPAAAVACYAGVQIHGIGGHSIAGAWRCIPLTMFWLVGCANAFNLIDGLDGLATGVGLFATATAFLSALISGNAALAFVTAPLAGALLGFLPYNFNPASIFMGDCGSMTVGFLLGCFGVIWSQKSATLLGMTAPLIALAIPLLDTALAIARRFLRHQPVFGADRGHIHHRLLKRGFTPRRVAYILYASVGIAAGLSLLLGSDVKHSGGAALVAFCVIVWLSIQYLGYKEFDAARHMIFGGIFRRTLNANLSISQLEMSVWVAHTVDDCWGALVETSRGFGFSEASLEFGDLRLSAQLAEADPAGCWDLRIPLNHYGRCTSASRCVPGRRRRPSPDSSPQWERCSPTNWRRSRFNRQRPPPMGPNGASASPWRRRRDEKIKIEDTAPTAHEKIRIYAGNGMPESDIEMWLLCLREACETRDAGRLVVALKEIVLDYSPSTHLLKRVIPARAVPA